MRASECGNAVAVQIQLLRVSKQLRDILVIQKASSQFLQYLSNIIGSAYTLESSTGCLFTRGTAVAIGAKSGSAILDTDSPKTQFSDYPCPVRGRRFSGQWKIRPV